MIVESTENGGEAVQNRLIALLTRAEVSGCPSWFVRPGAEKGMGMHKQQGNLVSYNFRTFSPCRQTTFCYKENILGRQRGRRNFIARKF